MKKTTAFLLAVCMCVSLVFVAPIANAETASVSESHEVVYNLVPDLKGGNLWDCTEEKVSTYYSNPNWSFFDMAEIFEQIVADYPNILTEGAVMTSGQSATAVDYAYTRMLNFSKGNYFLKSLFL